SRVRCESGSRRCGWSSSRRVKRVVKRLVVRGSSVSSGQGALELVADALLDLASDRRQRERKVEEDGDPVFRAGDLAGEAGALELRLVVGDPARVDAVLGPELFLQPGEALFHLFLLRECACSMFTFGIDPPARVSIMW